MSDSSDWEVPNLDASESVKKASPNSDSDVAPSDELERRLLDFNAENERLFRRDYLFRLRAKRVAVVFAILIIVGMTLFLWHALHKVEFGTQNSIELLKTPFALVVVVVPLVSITTTGIALLMAAFGRANNSETVAGEVVKAGVGVFGGS